jgi:hypothetical protein
MYQQYFGWLKMGQQGSNLKLRPWPICSLVKTDIAFHLPLCHLLHRLNNKRNNPAALVIHESITELASTARDESRQLSLQ